MPLSYQWLGTAGLEFTCEGYTLLVDPFFTRPSKWALVSGRRVAPDRALAARYAPRADAVLVTHPHYDHLMDVPAVLEYTRARVFGSPNTRELLELHGVDEERIEVIGVGDRFTAGPFLVEVFPARHTRTPLDRWMNGPLPRGVRQPCRLLDYRMDACYSFRISAGEHVVLVGNHPVPAQTLFFSPYHSDSTLRELLSCAGPSCVVPIHWDDFTRPLSAPLQPMLITRSQGVSGFRLVRRLDLREFSAVVQRIRPEAQVEIPEIFKTNRLG